MEEVLGVLGISEERYLELFKQWMRAEDALLIAAFEGRYNKMPRNPGLLEFMLEACKDTVNHNYGLDEGDL